MVRELDLRVVPPYQTSYALIQGTPQLREREGRLDRFYSESYRPAPNPGAHLEFAIKHEGFHLDVLLAAFQALGAGELERCVAEKPNGKYTRKLWFLYEYLTGRRLGLADCAAGYVELLRADRYVTGPPWRSRRHRIVVNLLGDHRFAPIVRRTPALEEHMARPLSEQAGELQHRYDADALSRAMRYLYTRETRSSFAIERETPSQDRVERYGAALRRSLDMERLTSEVLVELQRVILDPRFAEDGYRTTQNYVGERRDFSREVVHYACPQPRDVPDMMAGLIEMTQALVEHAIDPVVAAAVASFGLVLVHPFEDGNGRLHRWLIHWVLARMGFTPDGVIVPVSAVMLQRQRDYDRVLETFSQPLIEVLDFDLNEAGEMRVRGETAHHYRYFDATRMAEALYEWVTETIEVELPRELDHVVRHRRAVVGVRAVVDLPDRLRDLFISCVRQNRMELSSRKRASHFSMLTDDEVGRLEAVVADAFGE